AGTPRTLAVPHAYLVREGDAWTWTNDYLKRVLDGALPRRASVEEFDEMLAGYSTVGGTRGRRLAELHNVLAEPVDDAAFDPRPATPEAAASRARAIAAIVDQARELLGQFDAH